MLPVQVFCLYRCFDFSGVLPVQVFCLYRRFVFADVLSLQLCCPYKCSVFTGVLTFQVCCPYKCSVFTGVLCVCLLGYLIFYTTDVSQDKRHWVVEGELGGDKLSTIVSDLSADTVYYFMVQARNRGGYSPMSSIVKYRTPVGKPPACRLPVLVETSVGFRGCGSLRFLTCPVRRCQNCLLV